MIFLLTNSYTMFQDHLLIYIFRIADIQQINAECLRLNLLLIPLVQTCGHLEVKYHFLKKFAVHFLPDLE